MQFNLFKYYSLKRFKFVVAFLIAALSMGFMLLQPVSDLEHRFLDYRFNNWIGDVQPDERITLISIDDNSLDFFAQNGISWPWPRSFYAHIVNYFSAAGAETVVFDMLFSHPDADRSDTDAEETDGLFANAMANSHKVILGLTLDNRRVDRPITGAHPTGNPQDYQQLARQDSLLELPIPIFLNNSAGVGHTNISPDRDGIFRRVSPFALIEQQLIPNLAMAAYLVGKDGLTAAYGRQKLKLRGLDIPLTDGRKELINWYGPAGPTGIFKYFPFSAVIQSASAHLYGGEPALAPGLFKGKIVIIGADASGLRDLKASPVMKNGMHPGMEVWATVLSNMLQEHFIFEFPEPLLFLLLAAMAFILLLGFDRLKARFGFMVLLGQLLLYFVLGYLLWRGPSRIYLPFVPAIFSSLLAYLLVLSNEMRERLFLKKVFGAYVSPELMDIMHKTRQAPVLGGEQVSGSAFFSDLQGFTTFSEKLTPVKLVALLNEYLTVMTDTLMDHRGTLDKYEGDAIIAFFGAPVRDAEHAVQAVRAGIAMQQGLADLRHKWAAEGAAWPSEIKDIQMRIGINSGDMLVGNVGSEGRMNYTMMGDTVNVAARLESSAKQYGVLTHISAATAELMPPDIVLRKLGATQLLGKTQPAVSYEVLGYPGDLTSADRDLLALWPQIMQAIEEQQWQVANALLAKTLPLERNYAGRPTNPSLVYLEQRIPFWMKQDLEPDWKAVWIFDSK